MTAVSIREASLENFFLLFSKYLAFWEHIWFNRGLGSILWLQKNSEDKFRLDLIFVAKIRFYLWSFCNVFTTWLFYKPIMGLTKMTWTLQCCLHLTEASSKLSMKQENISEKKFLGTRVRSSKRCCVRFPTLRFMSTRPLDSLPAFKDSSSLLPRHHWISAAAQSRKKTCNSRAVGQSAATAFPTRH